MTQNSNILQELSELDSSLAQSPVQQPYSVPEGYFDGLAAAILSRIRALEARDPREELGHLSPLLSGLSRELPYTVSAEYFESIDSRLAPVVKGEFISEDARLELVSLSPFLGGLKKEMPYSVPEGYFENLSADKKQSIPLRATEGARVIPISRSKWYRVAVAALIVGFLATAGIIYFTKVNTPGKSLAKFEKTVDKEIKKSSDKELNEFIEQFTLAGLTGTEKASIDNNKADTRISLKDVSDAELKQFLEETSDADPDDLSATPVMN